MNAELEDFGYEHIYCSSREGSSYLFFFRQTMPISHKEKTNIFLICGYKSAAVVRTLDFDNSLFGRPRFKPRFER